MNVHKIARLPSAPYIIDRAIFGEPVARKQHYELAEKIVAALHDAGWRLVPGRPPMANHNEVHQSSAIIEGEITTRQLIDQAAAFDDIDEDLFSAADFVAWLIPEVRGSPEWEWLEKRRVG